MTDPIDARLRQAIEACSLTSFHPDKGAPLAHLFAQAGQAAFAAKTRNGSRPLVSLANMCSNLLIDLLGWEHASIVPAIEAEYRRAYAKRQGLTPYSPRLTDDMREAILLEEVGEVARAFTPDAHTSTGHGVLLVEELIQVMTMAAAWAAYYEKEKELQEYAAEKEGDGHGR